MLMLALLALTAQPELQVRASAAFVHPVWVDLACDPRGAWCSVPRAPRRLCPSTLPTPCLRQGMRMQFPRPLGRPRLLGQPTDAVSSLAKNIGQVATSVDHPGNNIGQGAVAISRVAYMIGMAGMIGKMDGTLSPRDVGLGMAIVILAMEMVLGWLLPWSQGRGVSSASKIDKARRDYDSLRSFYDTTATGNQLVKHVLKRTKGKDLSDRAFDKVRPAIERCRVA
jgi:hypothetical protein